jgi:hypothetical protein
MKKTLENRMPTFGKKVDPLLALITGLLMAKNS